VATVKDNPAAEGLLPLLYDESGLPIAAVDGQT
jgi:hypothetical protein